MAKLSPRQRLATEIEIFVLEYREMDSIRNPFLRNSLRGLYLIFSPLYFMLALLVNPLLMKGINWLATRGIDAETIDDTTYCQEYRDQLELQKDKVPARLQHLLPLAEQFGVGDGRCRVFFLRQATPAQRQWLRAAAAEHDEEIVTWLDSFPEGEMSKEAAAFMYMLAAEEEMDLDAANNGID